MHTYFLQNIFFAYFLSCPPNSSCLTVKVGLSSRQNLFPLSELSVFLSWLFHVTFTFHLTSSNSTNSPMQRMSVPINNPVIEWSLLCPLHQCHSWWPVRIPIARWNVKNLTWLLAFSFSGGLLILLIASDIFFWIIELVPTSSTCRVILVELPYLLLQRKAVIHTPQIEHLILETPWSMDGLSLRDKDIREDIFCVSLKSRFSSFMRDTKDILGHLEVLQ